MAIFKTVRLVFKWPCFIVVVVYAINSFREFIQNDDLCEVNFIRFHSDNDSIYPTFTMCFNTPFVEEKLQKLSSKLDMSLYESYLLGRRSQNENLTNIDYNNVTIKQEDFLRLAYVRYRDIIGIGSIKNVDIIDRSYGYVKGLMKCFSFEIPFKKDTLVTSLNIYLNNTVFRNGERQSNGWLSKGLTVFYHYPKQFGR